MTDDLVGRLRKRADQHGMLLSDPPKPTADNALLSEAAARIEALEGVLRECAKPYFWNEDGFWADASTPAYREQELHRRLTIARAALAKDKSDG